jgi:hypothetical protein
MIGINTDPTGGTLMVRCSILALVLSGCGTKAADSASADDVDGPTLEAPPEDAGFQLNMSHEVPPYSEVWVCEVYPLPTEDSASVNWIEYQQTEGMHHMTLSTMSLSGVYLEPGLYECDALFADNMDGQLMFFGAQGDAEGTMHLPDGVAATFPPGIQVIHEMHYVNPTKDPVNLYSRINAWTIPSEEVVEGIWGGQVRDENIEIPAEGEHSEWTRCVFNEDVDVLFLASHTHELGSLFTVSLFDGETVGEEIYRNDDLHTPLITQYVDPLSLKAGEGFEYTCSWDNPRGEPVSYGLTAQDEMCNLAIVHMPMSVTAECTVVESSDGVLWKN